MSYVSLESCFADGAGFSGRGQCCNQQVHRTAGGSRTRVDWRSPTGVVLTGLDKSLHLWFSTSSTGKWGVSVRGSLRYLPAHWASLVAQTVKNPPATQETRVWFPHQDYPLEKEMATHASIPAWRIPWTEEPGGLQSRGSQRVGHNWAISTFTFLSSSIDHEWSENFKRGPLCFTSPLWQSELHFACKPEIAPLSLRIASVSSNILPNDSGIKLVFQVADARGSPGTSRLRTKEIEGGREQEEAWKDYKKKTIGKQHFEFAQGLPRDTPYIPRKLWQVVQSLRRLQGNSICFSFSKYRVHLPTLKAMWTMPSMYPAVVVFHLKRISF